MKSKNKAQIADQKYFEYQYSKPDVIRISKIIKWAGNKNTILDIGCGVGFIGKKLIVNDNKLFGIDISPKCIHTAIKEGINAQQTDIEEQNIPFNENFDVIIAAEIIEHVIDTDSFLQKIKTSLNPDGKIIITTPNVASLGRRLLLLVGKNPVIEFRVGGDNAGHLRYFTKDTLFQILRENGFEITRFESDIVNFDSKGRYSLKILAKIFPTLGKSLIVEAKIKK